MSAPLCVVCGRPTADGFACQTCGVDRPAAQLAEVADMTPAARMVAYGQGRQGTGEGGNKPGSRMELNLAATARLDAVQNSLTTWARLIASERGIDLTLPLTPSDPITAACGFLSGQTEWMRHRPEVAEWLDDVERCARVIRSLARGPGESRFLGPCGALLLIEGVDGPWPCDGDVYARVHPDGTTAKTGTCRACKATVDTGERQAWLDGEVRNHVFRAAEIGNAYGVNVNTIRTWHARGLLAAHGEDREGRPLFNVGEVLDLFRDLAVRRAENEAKKARKSDERMSA